MAPPVGPLSGGSAGGGCLGDAARFGVVTVSDRASSGAYDDLSGPAILHFLADAVESPWTAEYRLVADEQPSIEAAIVELARARPPPLSRLSLLLCVCLFAALLSGGGRPPFAHFGKGGAAESGRAHLRRAAPRAALPSVGCHKE
jgi:hypothetical protein